MGIRLVVPADERCDTHATTVVESSSGSFALALAFYCRMIGIPFVPVTDPNRTTSAAPRHGVRRHLNVS